jgi:hypothetical protein
MTAESGSMSAGEVVQHLRTRPTLAVQLGFPADSEWSMIETYLNLNAPQVTLVSFIDHLPALLSLAQQPLPRDDEIPVSKTRPTIRPGSATRASELRESYIRGQREYLRMCPSATVTSVSLLPDEKRLSLTAWSPTTRSRIDGFWAAQAREEQVRLPSRVNVSLRRQFIMFLLSCCCRVEQ